MQTSIPVLQNERAPVLDILRAFALLGIIMANSGFFSLYIFQKREVIEALPTAAFDKVYSWFHFAFIDGKFYSVFSLLFGIGFSIIISKNGKTGLFYRRLFILLLFGVAHSLLIWDGDILMFYAVVGMLLPLFRHCRDRTLLVLVPLLLLSPLLFDLLKVISEGKWNLGNWFVTKGLAADKASGITEDNLGTWLITHTSYSDNLAWYRSGFWWNWQHRIDTNRIPKVLAMFLLGLWVGRKKMYAHLNDYRSLLKKVQAWGFVIGIPAGIARAYCEFDAWHLPQAGGLLDTALYALNVAPLGLAYACTIALIFMNRPNLGVWQWLMPAGRMALTNYIMQSVICIFIFHGIGWALGGKLGPVLFVPIAIAVYVVQLIISRIWFQYFSYGPLEWIWRMLTYGRLLPVKK